MNVIHDVTIDLLRPQRTVIRVTQEDSARKIRMTLLADNAPYNVAQGISEEVLAFVEYRKADGTGGMYDTTATGDTAVELEDTNVHNVWLVSLDGNCFTCPGWCQVNVRFETESGKRIHTFAIMVDVSPTASSDTESTDWGELNSIADLRNAVADLAVIVERIAGNTGITEEMKQAFLDCFAHVAWIDEHGQDHVDALESALYPPAELLAISAVFEQGETVIYDTDSLDDLKPMLTVTARYTDGTSAEVTTYTLSGTLTIGTATITVSYGGKTATFDVVVTDSTILPAEFQAVEYIAGSGNQYIDTGVTLSNAEVRLKTIIAPTQAGLYNTNAIAVRKGTNAGDMAFNVSMNNTATSIMVTSGNGTGHFGTAKTLDSGDYLNKEVEIDATISSGSSSNATITTLFTFEGATETLTNSGVSFNNGLSHVFLWGNKANASSAVFKGRIYMCQIWDNNVLVLNAVPCYRKADGIIGMYDFVSSAFMTNSGTGTFTKGDDV